MSGIDHFKVLGLEENATADDIKMAYFGLAKLHHPDACKTANSADRFRIICSSYEVLKNEKTKAEYLLQKNGNDWEKRVGGPNKYNDVRTDYEKARRTANKQSLRDINNFMNTFERLIHPKNLFVLIPSGILAYWMMTSYVPTFFSKNKIDDGSVAGNIKAKASRTAETVDAWKNPKTNRWESPAPWDPGYKTYIATNPLEKVDRNQVSQARPGDR